ncbi:copper resistance protein B [Tsuneonella sp. HG094]
MKSAVVFLAGISALAVAAPAAGQSHDGHHGDHAAEAPAPPKEEMGEERCSPEHAAMGHCTLEEPSVAPIAPAGDPECPPEHAAMGHCTPAEVEKPAPTGAVGTDLPPGDAPAPPPPSDWYADRVFSKAEMDHARHAMMGDHGTVSFGTIAFNLAEYQARKGGDGYRWDAEGWLGGDIDRVVVKSEGEGTFGEAIEVVETQLLYGRALNPYFNLQAGVRQDFGHGPDRTYAAIGFEGLAPYWFEVEGALFVSNKGDFHARFEGYYDQRITQRLILQPMAEVNFALQDVPERGTGSGLSDIEAGLRLRYEVVKEFAPYVGVEWTRKFGDTARFARLAGDAASATSLVAGLRIWF